ncbi:MAG TPA: ATP-binding cassette domain-containing protein, partial [Amaricoccus sp.]|nr:ATP-binding cassette domain-containing protein [Amaricoccus sp.]
HIVTAEVADITPDFIVNNMVGRVIGQLYPPKRAEPQAPDALLEVRGLSDGSRFRDVGFTLGRGEILGIAGLIGAGRTEAFEGLCGLRPASGEVRVKGRPVKIRKPWEALALGICYLTEDRKTRGLLLDKGMRENLTLQALARFSHGLIDTEAEEAALDGAVAAFDIRGSRAVRVGNLSGGNQQKLLFAKTMLSEPEIVIIDEPTRGVDIGTKQQMYGFIRKLAAEGRAIVVISSEMQELIGLADRVIVMRRGRIVGELAGTAATEEAIVRLAMGVMPAGEMAS